MSVRTLVVVVLLVVLFGGVLPAAYVQWCVAIDTWRARRHIAPGSVTFVYADQSAAEDEVDQS